MPPTPRPRSWSASSLPRRWPRPLPSTWPTSRPRWSASPAQLRLACAEASLSDPQLSTPAGLVAARIGRGVAISVDGELRALHPRPAGRALAARFAALHARLLGESTHGRRDAGRQAREGLWLLERRIRPGAAAWLFDDLPFAAVDEVAADALTATARALLRRPAPVEVQAEPIPITPPRERRAAAGTDALQDTLVAVARSNGRVAPAARLLGVHRNTVLYRLRRARDERGLDPRLPQDALRILSERRRATIAADPLIGPCAQCTRNRALPNGRDRPLRWGPRLRLRASLTTHFEGALVPCRPRS